MLDIKLVRDNVEELIKRLNTRGQDYSYLRDVVKYDKDRRSKIQEVEVLKQESNELSKKIGQLKREGGDVNTILAKIDTSKADVQKLDTEIKNLEEKVQELLAATPNVPRETITIGLDEADNKLLRTYGVPKNYSFKAKPHYEIAEELDIVDFERASKLSGSRFAVYKGLGAKLERALISFMLDLHTNEHGYTELITPYLVNGDAMFGTGQLPKFSEDMFKIEGRDLYLIPTAEVPVTNYHANEVLQNPEFPIKYTAHTPCFRAEAGSAGRDTRGLIRQHQFNKVELVMLSHPDESYKMLDILTSQAEEVLKRLELPYQLIELCTGDIGFSSAITNDIEVWMPRFDTYREISSCSNFESFQARRANIKFKNEKTNKLEFIHTLNGSGLAIGRTFAAILENYQNEDGSVTIPKVLVPYMGGITVIKKND